MKKFAINISYSWGDEEEPIEFEAEDEYDALCHVIYVATEELKVSFGSHENSEFNIRVDPVENKVTLYYGYDGEECYYELTEV